MREVDLESDERRFETDRDPTEHRRELEIGECIRLQDERFTTQTNAHTRAHRCARCTTRPALKWLAAGASISLQRIDELDGAATAGDWLNHGYVVSRNLALTIFLTTL